MNLAALHTLAKSPHHIAVAMVCAVVAILAHGATELRHHHHGRFLKSIAQTLDQGVDGFTQKSEPIGELPFTVALIHMSIPSADGHKG